MIIRTNTWILSFCAEQSIDPSILVLNKSHVVHVRIRSLCLRKIERIIPEIKIIDAIIAFRNCEKRFAVLSFYSCDKNIFFSKLYRAGIKYSIDPETLHQIWITCFIEIILPEQRRVFGSKH